MEEKYLYDISEVCKMLGTTSRTLRFYEEKGIITSTTIGLSARRQYTEEQLSNIRNVLVLRTLGLSVKSIEELQTKKKDLKDAVISRRAEIFASIDSRLKEINLLNEALCALDLGKNIFNESMQVVSNDNSQEFDLARICTNAIINNNDELLYKYLSPRLVQYMPKDVYRIVRDDTFAPIGTFVSNGKIEIDQRCSNKLYSMVRYSKLGLKITFVFHRGMIDGLWLGYYNTAERG